MKYIKLKPCFNKNHLDGAWYEGEQHYLGFHGQKLQPIANKSFFKLLFMYLFNRNLPFAKFIPANDED